MHRPLTALCSSLAILLIADVAFAQPDVEKPLSNVLLLVDTSGSMEFTASGDTPVCNPGQSSLTNDRSRWIDLVEVLTGSIQDYSCFAQDRSSTAFVNEFSLGSTTPYDYGYVNPFHRILSGSCTVGPGELPTSTTPWDFPTGAVNTFSYSSGVVVRPSSLSGYGGCSGFSQYPNGILDIYSDRLRFGLMTFDTHLDAGTGVSSGSADYAGGVAGTFSYYVGSSKTGRPAGCTSDLAQEVGARNQYAPPWEGRLVAFGPQDADVTDTDLRNEWIQDILLATRPYGATPIAGMLDDAKAFLFDDTSSDPFNSSSDFGPYQDSNWLADECRKTTIILLSDGEPNLDLRPFCEATGGVCPFQEPHDIAAALLDEDPSVETIVIGFGLPEVTIGSETIACEDLSDDDCSSDPSNTALQACCTLNAIAADGRPADSNGNPRTAYFADDRDELREVFSTILSQLSTNISTRTAAVFTTASNTTQGGAFQFNSGFTPSAGSIWKGSLTRTRTICVDGVPEEQEVDAVAGDDFIANANSGSGTARRLYTALPSSGSAANSLRPYLGTPSDGLEQSSATTTAGVTAENFASLVSAEDMQVDSAVCGGGMTDSACRDLILDWTIGLTNSKNQTRCATEASCNLVGGIYHSTPKVVPGRPTAALRDESYQAFVAEQATAERDSVLYVSSVDGFLHAFKVAPFAPNTTQEVNEKENNLLWSFIPPAILPVLQAQYPNTPATLLDGEPIVRDVVARQDADSGDYLFERTVDDARSGAGTWRTVLVSGFGDGQVQGGYFALDVTDPNVTTGGPRLLWQLTRDEAGNALFGSGGTPLITTLYFQEGTAAAKEVAVAVLPGGDAGTAGALTAAGDRRDVTDDNFESREDVRSYTGAAEARSLTIVRLDTGEIIRSFRGTATSSAIDSSVTSIIEMPAPLVGIPAAYPGRVGDVADRLFVGDREGRLWAVNVASQNPASWTMEVAFDAFWDLEDSEASQSQPVETAPTLSVDDQGQLVVIFSTGDQRVQSASSTTLNRIVSFTETLDDSNNFDTELNWIETLQDSSTPGERVTGRMSLFGGTLYFSTGAPPGSSAGACATGSSRIWGVDYRERVDDDDPTSGPLPRLQDPNDPDALVKSYTPESGIVFGVGIERQPTCSSSVEAFSGDPYSGLGSYTTQQDVSAGGFFLVYQVGGATGTSSAGRVETVKTELPVQQRPALVESWALISE